MLEDLLNSMQNHEDWRGQAMHGHQEAGAAAAATAPVFFGVGEERHIFQLAMELRRSVDDLHWVAGPHIYGVSHLWVPIGWLLPTCSCLQGPACRVHY